MNEPIVQALSVLASFATHPADALALAAFVALMLAGVLLSSSRHAPRRIGGGR